MYVAIILSHANSVINPFIYAYRIREFRRTFRKIIRSRILGRQELLESRSSKRTTHNSITDSISLKTNGFSFDRFPERITSTSSYESSYRCSTNISPVGGGLMAASNLPLSVVISHCPKVGPCPLNDVRQSHIAVRHHLQHAEHECTGSDVVHDKDKENLASSQAVSLLKMCPDTGGIVN